jgi:hypothetical protein
VKAAKTGTPISTANAKAIRASKNLAIQPNAELASSYGLAVKPVGADRETTTLGEYGERQAEQGR